VLLEKEVLYRYNRAYLLGSLCLSLIIPAITFTQEIPIVELGNSIITDNTIYSTSQRIVEEGATIIIETQGQTLDWITILWLIYAGVTFILLLDFIFKLTKLYGKIRKAQCIPYRQGSQLVLTRDMCTPCSFLNYIFLNQAAYAAGNIDEKVLCHELAHVRQRHSYDNILLELLTVFFWFNPMLMVYKRFIHLNHEYLADKSVLEHHQDIIQYQYLLINMTGNLEKPGIVSQFNFLFTKKRLIMMTKTTSQKKKWLKQLITLPFVLVALFLFSNKTVAYVPTVGDYPLTSVQETTQENRELSPVQEFNSIHAKGIVEKNGQKRYDQALLSPEDIDRMRTLFLSMTTEEQDKLNGVFLRRQAYEENIPPQEEMEAWKDPTQYGIWLDGKRIDNAELNNYQRTDFAHYMKSRLMANAKDYGKYVYHLSLVSKEANQKIAEDETLYFYSHRIDKVKIK
ncbi:M56 family metallopeptidase, partial [Parabacteroides sp. OttesenSCG-928-J18]|nr:M56 family metallopeptidase [Parabacteroides sp. OttesenSCG-928-J18]